MRPKDEKRRYIVTFLNKDKYSEFISKFSKKVDIECASDNYNIYFITLSIKLFDILKSYCSRVEFRPIGNPVWRPINLEYRSKLGQSYGDYTIHPFSDGLGIAIAEDPEPGKVIGPWYIMNDYLGLIDTWNVTQGSGAVISCQEKFDYSHPGYSTNNDTWSEENYQNIYEDIIATSHSFMIIDYENTPAISELLNRCFFYSGGTDYSVEDYKGCYDNELPYYDGLSFFEPQDCHDLHFVGFGDSTCINGEWNWDDTDVPRSFTPFGHGDIITSIFGARMAPRNDIINSGEAVGPAGVAPKCTILLGNNGDSYLESESYCGLDIRIGSFDGQWSQTEADLAYPSGVMLVRGPGSYLNCETTTVLGQTVPYNTLTVGTLRYKGSNTKILRSTEYDYTTTGNYGYYAGYGRNNYMYFATPSIGVWCHHPRYNFKNWGAWGGSYSGASIAPSFAGGLLALMKSAKPTWSWEDIITSICQTCKTVEFRAVPHHLPQFGLTKVRPGYSVGISDTSINASGNDNVSDSVAWYYAYPSGASCDIYGRPYSLLQFGIKSTSSDYELIYYSDIDTEGTIISGGTEPYTHGQFTSLYRGYGGTIAKTHTDVGNNIYTPLLVYSGWSPYLGYGMPDMRAAIAVTDKSLEILQPQRVTISTIESNEIYYNNRIQFEIIPFRSSNYDGVMVVKNHNWFPLSPTDGEICFTSNDMTSAIITGYDDNLVNLSTYYSVFQFTKGPKVKYSKPTMRSAEKISYEWNKFNVVPTEIGNSLILNFSIPAQSEYALISGFWMDTDLSYKGFANNNQLTITGLNKDDTINITGYILGDSQNLISSWDYNTDKHLAMPWTTELCSGDSGTYSVQKYHEAKYGLWSTCLTISGNSVVPPTGPFFAGIIGDYINTSYIDYKTEKINYSIYAKSLSGSGILNLGFKCYDVGMNLLSSYSISSYIISGLDWEQYDGISLPESVHVNTAFLFPYITVSGLTPGQFSSILVSNPQITSGEDLQTYSIYQKPFYDENSVYNPICKLPFSYTFQGEPEAINSAKIMAYDSYFEINMDRIIDSTDSGVELIGPNNEIIATITGYGDIIESVVIPNYLRVRNKQGTYVDFNDILIINRKTESKYHKYSVDDPVVPYKQSKIPSFSDGPISGGRYLLEISFGDSYIPEGLIPYYNLSIPIYIRRNNNIVNAIVSLWIKKDSKDVTCIDTINGNSVFYYRSPYQSTFLIQAATAYGEYIESNVLTYSG